MSAFPRSGMPRHTARTLSLLGAAALSVAGVPMAAPAVAATGTAEVGTAEGGSAARAVTGATAIARAKVWVDRGITYSQSTTYQGYRMDCSGYVSMAWGLAKPGYTTYTLPKVGKYIIKGALRPGDALLDPNYHVVLFEKWADSAHTSYWAYEESSSHNGAIHRIVPYPYWAGYGTYRPFRFYGMT
jgi:hypothetical protein